MVSVFSFSEVGGHRLNEDAFQVQPHPRAAECWLCFVADGQGGQAGGGPAARLTCSVALEAASACRPEALIEPFVWPELLRQTDLAVEKDPAAGYTTLIGLCAFAGRIAGGSSGDSAALLMTGRKAIELTAGQHKNPPVGSGAAVVVPFAARVERPWSVLAMSDGVWKYVGWQRVVEVASHERGQGMLEALQQLARLPGSGQFPDDFTVVLLEESAAG
jgi:serine/threonine protein phosphatase PrpC